MKRFNYRTKSLAFSLWNFAPRLFEWTRDGATLVPKGRFAAPWVEITRLDIITPLGRLGQPVQELQEVGKVWKRDVAGIAEQVGAITRVDLRWNDPDVDVARQPPSQGADNVWQWKALALHASAGLELLGLLKDINLPDVKDHVAWRHNEFNKAFPPGHPIRQPETNLPESPWTHALPALGLGSRSPGRAASTKHDVIQQLRLLRRGAVENQLAHHKALFFFPNAAPRIAATPVTLALLQLMWAYDKPGRLRNCLKCDRPFFARDNRHVYCDNRCVDSEYKENNARASA